MESQQLEQLKNKDAEQIKLILGEFNEKNADLFNFVKFHTDDQWHALWLAVFAILGDTTLASLHPLCLNTVRILTRDEMSLNMHDVVNELDRLIELAQLSAHEDVQTISVEGTEVAGIVLENSITDTIVESLKCLCNLVFQNVECRKHCVKSSMIDGILRRVASSTQHSCKVELYDMKLLFLITALEPATRMRVQIDLNGVAYMTEWLNEKVMANKCTDEELDVLCEMLKVLFNITTNPNKSFNANEIENRHLAGVIRKLLLRFGTMNNERERGVVTHAINLLTNISSDCLTELLTKGEPQGAVSSDMLLFEGYNVCVLEILLRYLHTALEEQANSAASGELIPPVLTVLVKCVRCHPIMRHYIRSAVLPPLRDVSQRPEVGNELRNHLCRMLTLPAMLIRDLAAELLFVCCKENVGRMIKYTGYGNAAGLFANRGLLDCRRVENTQYSSDSEDSDTEEYKQVQHGINPVLGCYEPSKPSPLEGMSEEQKEYEAMKLVNLMDKLHKSGVVQPCRIGEDGKPQPVDHILQLQDELPQQQFEQKRKT